MSYEMFETDYEDLEVLEDDFGGVSEMTTYLEVDEFSETVDPVDKKATIQKGPSKSKYVYKNIKNVNDMLDGTSRLAFEADMLDAIFDCPPLYDYTLPIKSRSPTAINDMWGEVKSELQKKYPNLAINVDLLKTMYKNIRNNYTRYKTGKDKVPSGTSQKVIPEPKHVDKLRRLDGVLQKRKQKSSLDLEVADNSSQSSIIPSPINNESEDDCNMTHQRKRIRTLSSNKSITPIPSPSAADFLEPLQKLVANVSQPPQPPPPVDMEELFSNQVKLFLRELNTQEKYAAQLYFMTYMNEIMKNKNT